MLTATIWASVLFWGSSLAKWPSTVAQEYHSPSWPDYVNATERWSTYAHPTFNGVFIPKTESDLATGLRYLSSKKKPFLAQSGGHGYSVTLETVQDAVLINMENFAYQKMNSDHSVTIGTGTTFGQLVDIVGKAGRELTVGFCPGVGAVGAMLGGGLGRLQGLYGLTSDALRSARMVTWNGTVVQASATVNKDLFWGIKGAGQNFGVITEAVFETFPAANSGMQYTSDLVFPIDKLEAVMKVTDSLMSPHLDPALAIATAIQPDPKTLEPTLRINIVYPGPMKKGQAFRKRYSPLSSNFTEQMTAWTNLGYAAFPDIVAGGIPTGYPHNQYSVLSKSLPVESFSEAIDSLKALLKQYPGLNETTIFVETFGQKAISDLPANSSAFPHRHTFNNAIVFSMTYGDPSLAGVADDWAHEMRDKFAQPDVSGYDKLQIYQNYGHGDEPLSALYGYEKWRQVKLTGLKNKYDPHGLFNGYHAIPSRLEDWS